MSGISSIKQTPIATLTSTIQNLQASYALKTYVDQKISDVVANAPAVLDTLQELSAALGDNPNLVASIQASLNAEITRASAAERTLSTSIASIGSGSLTTISTTVGQEITRATAAEQSISTALVAEVARAKAAEQSISTGLSTALAAEISRATNAELTLSTALTTEKTRALAIEQGISSALVNEIARATATEQSISTALVAEIARATAAEQTLSTTFASGIASTTTALQAELRTGLTSTATYVDTKVSTVVASAPAILDTLSEIATALGNDPQAVAHLTSSIQASNDYISSTKAELRSTIDYVTTTNTTSLQTHGLQSYSATPLTHRRKYTGPYAPSTFSTLYSAAGKNPYEHITNQGAAVILQPTTADQITTLPPYSTTWLRLGTIDLTTTGSNAAYTLSNLPSSYTGSSIPYYDIYIQPKSFYGSNANYGFVKGTTASPAKQVHQAHILTYTSNTPYSAISLGGPWSAIYRDDVPELERLVKITNGNTIGITSPNLFISAGSVVYEIAPGECAPFLYTNAGWSMVGDM